MPSALQKSECCRATSAAQLAGNCSAASVFARGMLQGWGVEGWGLGRVAGSQKALKKVLRRVLRRCLVVGLCCRVPDLSGHYLRDWSESVNVIEVISGPFACEFSK